MKKLIPLLLVLMSVGLYSQEAKYWEKIDFQFDSGIKKINFYPNYYYGQTDPFLIVTENNSIYYFADYKIPGQKINFDEVNTDIKDAQITFEDYNAYIYILTEDGRLFESNNFGLEWKQILDEIDGKNVNCMSYCLQFYGKNYSLIIGTDNGIYINNDKLKWGKLDSGLVDKNILYLGFQLKYWVTYCLTKDGKFYDYNGYGYIERNLWESHFSIDSNDKINKVGRNNNSYVYLNNNNELYTYSTIKIDLGDSITITSFATYIMILSGIIKDNQIPWEYPYIIGTKQHGVYLYCYLNNIVQLSDEFYGVEITEITVNREVSPYICLLGTKNGEVYFSEFTPTLIEDNYSNEIHTQISPQPASTKARLSFTLPVESRVSVKIYNTLGIEQYAFADDFFSEGENSITIDVSGLADGMYFVAIQYDGKTVVEKLVVRR